MKGASEPIPPAAWQLAGSCKAHRTPHLQQHLDGGFIPAPLWQAAAGQQGLQPPGVPAAAVRAGSCLEGLPYERGGSSQPTTPRPRDRHIWGCKRDWGGHCTLDNPRQGCGQAEDGLTLIWRRRAASASLPWRM